MHLFDDFLIVVLMNSIVVCCCRFLTRFRRKIFKNSQSCIVVESSESSWIAATCAVKVGLTHKLFVTSPRIITNSRRTKVTPSQILFSSF